MGIKSIMIVDDSSSDQYLAKHCISRYNDQVEVLQAYDGDEALDMLKKMSNPPTLILLDINMPRMTGLEFLDIYEKCQRGTNVVMLTSSDQDQDKEKALSYSVVEDYLVKPMDVKDLARIDEVLEH